MKILGTAVLLSGLLAVGGCLNGCGDRPAESVVLDLRWGVYLPRSSSMYGCERGGVEKVRFVIEDALERFMDNSAFDCEAVPVEFEMASPQGFLRLAAEGLSVSGEVLYAGEIYSDLANLEESASPAGLIVEVPLTPVRPLDIVFELEDEFADGTICDSGRHSIEIHLVNDDTNYLTGFSGTDQLMTRRFDSCEDTVVYRDLYPGSYDVSILARDNDSGAPAYRYFDDILIHSFDREHSTFEVMLE